MGLDAVDFGDVGDVADPEGSEGVGDVVYFEAVVADKEFVAVDSEAEGTDKSFFDMLEFGLGFVGYVVNLKAVYSAAAAVVEVGMEGYVGVSTVGYYGVAACDVLNH